ncbi:hypothetical protein AB7C87_09475 [Natrarchaeobius sp. A-rgal3]|uniref:hypothetical protein n=1 Tax=Natrarchaeobius versutus TaxID=1679078 RepID=UPI00350F08B9
MPETEQQDSTLSELIVKEAVEKGLDSPLRDSILEAVEEADERPAGRTLPLAGAVFGLGTAIGYLAGRYGPDLEETSFEDIEEPEIIEEVVEETDTETAAESIEIDEEVEDDGSSSRLPKLLLVLGAVAGIALLRRRLSESEDDEWEPIEEFEPATSVGTDEESDEDEAELEERDAEDGEGGEVEEDDEEDEGEADAAEE